MEGIVVPSCLEGTDLKVGDFVWAEKERPFPSSSSSASTKLAVVLKEEVFPEVDLSLPDEELVPILRSAASSWGFFRVFNHGIPQDLLDSISTHALCFFDLPSSHKLAIPRTPPLSIGYTSIARSSIIKAWSEALHLMPGEDRICGLLERVPSLQDGHGFSLAIIKYFGLVGELADRILRLLFRGLDVDFGEVNEVFRSLEESNLRFNHYPACPVADCTYGSPPHKDYGGLAILHQDDVGGLEVFRGGEWVMVEPKKGHLIINIGDLIQILSNGRYQSVLHRSLVNSSQRRLSFVFFYFPPHDAVIAPMPKLVTKDSPAKFKSFYMEDYRAMFEEAQRANHSPSLFFEEKLYTL